jgi:hypothetical protein
VNGAARVRGYQRLRVASDVLRSARQDVPRLLADHHASLVGREARDQADLPLVSTRLIPRDPEAVRMAELRFAIVRGDLVFCEDEFPIGLYVARVAIFLVERIDDQCAIDLDRRLLPFGVEHQPPAEPACRRIVALVQYCVRPVGDDLRRYARLVVRSVQRPDVGLGQAKRRAAGQQDNQRKCGDDG